MKQIIYEIFCDKCLHAISHYPGEYPTRRKLRKDKIIIVLSHCEKDRHYCKECAETFGMSYYK